MSRQQNRQMKLVNAQGSRARPNGRRRAAPDAPGFFKQLARKSSAALAKVSAVWQPKSASHQAKVEVASKVHHGESKSPELMTAVSPAKTGEPMSQQMHPFDMIVEAGTDSTQRH